MAFLDWEKQQADSAAMKEAERICRMQRAVAHLCEKDEGVELLRWILNEANFFTASYSGDLTSAAWNESRRAMACEIFSWCVATPEVMKALFAYQEDDHAC